jgi:putative ABC transport system ATP-binding protein
MKHNLLSLKGVSKVYKSHGENINALSGVDLELKAGEAMVVIGPSGSGKSTLLQIIGALDTASEGTVNIDGVDINTLSDTELSVFRAKKIGFVFQFFNLQSYLTVIDNVMLPGLVAGMTKNEASNKAMDILEKVGLTDQSQKLPRQLSGGQMQRVAIARALINSPAIILADEPTGNLDTVTADKIISTLESIVKEGISLIIITHDPRIAKRFSNKLELQNGKIKSTK